MAYQVNTIGDATSPPTSRGVDSESRDANPWGVLPCQARCLDAVIEHGSQKEAARALGLSHRTVEEYVSTASRLIRGEKADRITHLIQWDRFRRGGK